MPEGLGLVSRSAEETRADDPRASGIGASEIAAWLGLSPWMDPWTAYARKLHLIESEPPNERMRWGKRLEVAIALGFGEEAGLPVEWSNRTVCHPVRHWQFATPDAFVITAPRELVECKNVALDQSGQWDDSGTGEDGVPDYYAIQAHWQMSVTQLKSAYIVALIGGNDFRIYRLFWDQEIDDILVEEGERIWREHILAEVPPPMGASPAARQYLRRRFPRERERLRVATAAEIAWLEEYAGVRADEKLLGARRDALENQLTQAIGDAEGLTWGSGSKMTWKRTKDRSETNWEDLAKAQLEGYAEDEKKKLIEQYTEVSPGYRCIRFHTKKEAR